MGHSDKLAMRIDGGLDIDPLETQEWTDALTGVVEHAGPQRAGFLLERLGEHACHLGLDARAHPYSAYQNTIAATAQPPTPATVPSRNG